MAYSQTTLDAQKKLKEAGYDPGPLDGIWGPRTQAAQDAYKASLTNPVTPVNNSSYGGGTYNPQTGINTYPNGQTEEKFTWENGVPTNAGTGAAIATPIIGGDSAIVPKLDETSIMDYIQALQDASKSEDMPHYDPNLVQLTEEEKNEIIFPAE